MKRFLIFSICIFWSFFSFAGKGDIIFLSGNLGNLHVQMTLRISDDGKSLSGFYQYSGKNAWLSLSGRSTDGTYFVVEEHPYLKNEVIEGSATGQFAGIISTDNSFVGKWTNSKGSSILDFSLMNDCGQEGMCFYSGKTECDTNVFLEGSTENGIGISASIEYLRGNSGVKNLDFLLDTFIYNRLNYSDSARSGIYSKYPDYDVIATEYVNTNMNYDSRMEWLSGCEVVYNGNGILSIDNSIWEYSGGAHGNGYVEYNCFNLHTGKLISTDDIFLKGYDEPLRLKAVEHLSDDPSFVARDALQLNGNFYLTPEGIEFFYNSYEITCYMCGTPTAFIPWKELNQWIDPNGPMAWVKK